MKVLHVYRTYFPDTQGGLEEVIRQICLNTRAHGIESRVFTLTTDAETRVITSTEASIVRAKKTFEIASTGFSFDAFAEFRKQAQWADIVHYHFPWPFADLLHRCIPREKPTVLTYHSDIVRQRVLGWLYRPLMKAFLNSVDRIVATSPNYANSSEVLPGYRHKLQTIPIGINELSFRDKQVEEDSLEQVSRQYGKGFFLFIGILRYYKGLHILLQAIKSAPYTLVIAGTGPAEKELHEQAKQLQLDNVFFAGFVSEEEKLALLQRCKAVVFPSYLRSEAFGVTLLEGAMSGKPLISTEVGTGTSYINVDGETGLVVRPNCADELRQAMDRLHADKSLCDQLGRAGRKRYQALFTGRKMGASYSQLYAEMCDVDLDSLRPLDTEGIPVKAQADSVRKHYLP